MRRRCEETCGGQEAHFQQPAPTFPAPPSLDLLVPWPASLNGSLGTDILLPNVCRVRGARAEHKMAAQSFPSREAGSIHREERVPSRSTADHSVSPPVVRIPRDYNAANDLLERNLASGGAARLAYIDDAGQYTFAQLAERVNRFGSGLQAMGLEMEQRILIALTDTIDFPTAFLGSIKAGIIPVAVNTSLTPKDYEYMLADSRAK